MLHLNCAEQVLRKKENIPVEIIFSWAVSKCLSRQTTGQTWTNLKKVSLGRGQTSTCFLSKTESMFYSWTVP